MQLYPTRTAAHLAIAGVAMAAVGVAAREPAIVGWGGSVLLAMAIARAVTLVSVTRIRAAGFEMLWSGTKRVVRTARGSRVVIEAEVRNRDSLAARYVKLRAIASSQLEVRIEPSAGEVAASGRLKVQVHVFAPRVGQHGVHGLALEVHGASGLFEVPLTFANPYGVEVTPRALHVALADPRGGRSHLVASAGRPGRMRGEGSDLRELREHQPGDPFRRIAWRASARRGKLLVREYEREERDVVWIVLDVTVDLWAGPLGRAPLDLAIDTVSAIAARHLGRGDRTGLLLTSAGHRIVITPDHGVTQAHRIQQALTLGAGNYDVSRSDLDESDVAVRVIEHLRPLDARGLSDVRRSDLDKLAARADAARARAPFSAPSPAGRTPRERTLRRYLASFGIESPPKTDQGRKEADAALADALVHIAKSKPRASLVRVIAPAPEDINGAGIGEALRRLRRVSASVVWSSPTVEAALGPPWDDGLHVSEDEEPLFPRAPRKVDPAASAVSVPPIVAEAVQLRFQTATARREAALKRFGVRVLHATPSRATQRAPGAEPSPGSSDGRSPDASSEQPAA